MAKLILYYFNTCSLYLILLAAIVTKKDDRLFLRYWSILFIGEKDCKYSVKIHRISL